MASDDKEVCPLCMETMEADDLAFYPCDCRYQVCRFCWAKIINEENGLCPACRKEYNSEKPALYKPVSESDDGKPKCSRKRKEHMKKTKLTAEMLKLLPELRVVQPNLIFVVGLPPWICKDKEILKGPEYFGRYGKVFKVEINQNQTFGGPQGQPSFSAYITYCRSEDAMRSIRELDQGMIHGRPLRVSLGTTKYCSQFLRGAKCTKHECMYLHELGDPAASFTKEEMQAGKHTEYMNKLLVDYVSSLQTIGSSSLSNDDPPFNSTSSNLVSPSSFDSTDDGNMRGVSLKDSSHSHTFIRSRSRVDGGNGLSHGQSNPTRSHLKRSTDSDFHGKNTNMDSRRSRQHRGDCYLYSGCSPVDRSSLHIGKPGVWNPSEYHNTNESKQFSGRSTIRDGGRDYMNGFDGIPVDKADRKVNDHRRGHSTRVDHGRSTRKSSSENSFLPPPPPVSTSNFAADTQASWRSGLSPCDSSGNLNDEPVDIGFDPFRESQQGLAELLAAEVDRLNVTEDVSTRTTCRLNGQFPLRLPIEHFTSSFSPGLSSPGNRNVPSNKLPNFQWDSGFCPQDDGHGPSGDPFTNPAYPPPGFEEGTSSLRQTVNASSFFPNSELCHSDPNGPSGSPFSFMSMGLNDSNVPSVNGSLHENVPLFQSFFNATQTVENKFSSTNFDFNSQSKGLRINDISAQSSFRNYQPSNPSMLDSSLRPDQQQQQAIANLFAAAFNTASAMLNNRVPLSSDGKSSAVPAKITPPFDLNAFFNQLCRQSPLIAALNGCSTSSESWGNMNGSSRSWEHPGLVGDCSNSPSGTSASLFQSSRMPGKAIESEANIYRQDGLAFTNCTLPLGISKPDQFPFNSESSAEGSGFKSTLNAPTSDAFASSTQSNTGWKHSSTSNSPADLLQHMWQPGSVVKPPFDAHVQASYNTLPHTNSSDSTTVSPRQVLRDPSVHTVSRAQSAE